MTDQRFPAPSPANPLMQPVSYNGQTYYTSQYFHAMYLASHQDTAKKYTRHKDFARLVRSVEAYALYVEAGDIVELAYDKRDADSRAQNLRSLWKSTAYNPIMLINATAQLALVQHLDDELSKHMAYAVNTHMAREERQSRSQAPLPLDSPRTRLDNLEFGKNLLRSMGQFTPRDELAFADEVRNILITRPQLATTSSNGFSVAERVYQLGYRLSKTEERKHSVTLGREVAREYRKVHRQDTDYAKRDPQEEPRYIDGAVRNVKWYPESDATWLDAVIQIYLSKHGFMMIA